MKDQKRWLIAIGGMLWVCAICAGFGVLWAYGNTPGAPAEAPQSWPTDSRIRLASDVPTLVMIAHPRCPCTRASMTELSVLMTRCQGKLTASVLFIKPNGFDEGWEHTELWQEASRIPGVAVMSDPGGIEAARFGAATSGQALLYDSKGNLLFSGGITSARGHEGDNDGVNSIQSLVASTRAGADTRALPDSGPDSGAGEESSTPVFGCPLQAPGSTCRVEVNDANDNGQ